VLLVGDGAEKFADEMKGNPLIERVPNSYFDTEARRRDWLKTLEREKSRQQEKAKQQQKPAELPGPDADKGPAADKGTVGCVALDTHGNLAAGTSTGGVTNKKWGRVGDSPIIGAGTYAGNATCAVSCTGTGEYFIKHSAAFHVSALMAYKGLSLDDAVRQIIEQVLPTDTGGMIAVDRLGRISMRQNTPGMARAAADSSGRLEIELGK
jgi:beta-aspartyl-peptidase (threonine type)